MTYAVIDSDHPIALFHELLRPGSAYKVLNLLGAPNMGKSHLLTKVFPVLARSQAHCAMFDLGRSAYTGTDALRTTRHQLAPVAGWPKYLAAEQKRLERNRVQYTNNIALFSPTTIDNSGGVEDSQFWDAHLTEEFVADLAPLNDKPVVLLIDAVDQATESTQTWLMETFLVPFLALPQARAVLAGGAVPVPSGSYSARCREYTLRAIEDADAYIAYCRQLGMHLVDQSIRDMAHACDYTPGLFVNLVYPKFVPS